MFIIKTKKTKKLLVRLFTLTGNERRKAVTSPHMFSVHDWRLVLLEARLSLGKKNASVLSASSAFYAALAFFPLLAAIIAIVAYSVEVNELNSALSAIKTYFPIDIAALVGSQIQNAFEYNQRNVGVAIIAILIALFSATRAMYILVKAINVVYEEDEKRSIFKLVGLSFVMALGAIIIGAIVLGLVLVDQTSLMNMGIPEYLAVSLPVLRWVILAALIAGSLALFYRLAPSNHDPYWRWVSWGAGIASVVWLGGTTLFFLYAKYLSVYSNVYTVFGSVIVLLVWFNLSSSIILLGAAINQRLEQRTTRRTSL